MHRGRLTWTHEQMGKRGYPVSLETVRRWFAGEARPRPVKGKILADVFDVDFPWLQMGEDKHVDVRERRARNAMADGAVNIVAGLIQMDGGYPAFPDEDDQDARRYNVDMHAIIKGAKYDFHVARGEESDDTLTFHVPSQYERTIVLGLVRDGFKFEVFEITAEAIEVYGKRHGGSIEVAAPRAELRQIDNFKSRL